MLSPTRKHDYVTSKAENRALAYTKARLAKSSTTCSGPFPKLKIVLSPTREHDCPEHDCPIPAYTNSSTTCSCISQGTGSMLIVAILAPFWITFLMKNVFFWVLFLYTFLDCSFIDFWWFWKPFWELFWSMFDNFLKTAILWKIAPRLGESTIFKFSYTTGGILGVRIPRVSSARITCRLFGRFKNQSRNRWRFLLILGAKTDLKST